MLSGWRYRGAAVAGAVLLSMVAAGTAAYATAPTVGDIADPQSTLIAIVGASAAVGIALSPMYEPRPRRVTSMLATIYERIVVACLALAAIGYFGVSHALGPAALVLFGGILGLALPTWFWMLRRRDGPRRLLVVGDDASLIASVIRAVPVRPIGYLSPVLDGTADVGPSRPGESSDDGVFEGIPAIPDGGVASSGRISSIEGIDRLSGLSRLGHVLRDRDVDTVALAFSQADREEFFGSLRTCRKHGVDVVAHESVENSVFVRSDLDGQLTVVDLELWPWYSRIGKRAFDLAFAAFGLIVLTPLIVLVATAIKLDSPGPVFYSQTRTSELGGTFTVLKFRSMQTDAEAESGAKLSDEDAGGVDPRVTRVGRILRKTHLDEIPQLGSILVGDMSVVGPRPERPELDTDIQERGIRWEKRWQLKPGLTGIAQVNDATGFEPERKLSHDLEYARRRTFWFDVKLVALQIWTVVVDVVELISNRAGVGHEDDSASSD